LPDDRDEFCLRAMFIEHSGREVARAVLDRWWEELALHSARQLKHIATDLTFIEELRSW